MIVSGIGMVMIALAFMGLVRNLVNGTLTWNSGLASFFAALAGLVCLWIDGAFERPPDHP